MIWLAMAFPLVTLAYVLIFHFREIEWWEAFALIGVPIVILAGVKATAEYAMCQDTEYWGGWVKNTRFYEDWNEYIHQTCTRSYPCGTDSQGHTQYCTETYDCSYVQYHPEFWEVNGSNGESVNISRARFDQLCQQFGNKTFVDMKRRYHTNDGDMYQGVWAGEQERIEPITAVHSWQNRVQASKSVFKFPEVKDRAGLYDYPGIVDGYKQAVVMGTTKQADGVKRMEYWNAVLGAKKKVRIYTMLYRNLPLQKALDQQSLWMGGNKNEFNVAVGLDDADHVQWASVFSWSDIEGLKVEAKNYIVGQSTFSLKDFGDWLGPEIERRWVKKNFHDFDYLSVEPAGWVVGLAFFLSLGVSAGLGFAFVKNDVRRLR